MPKFKGSALSAAAFTAALGLAAFAQATTIALAPTGAGTVTGSTLYTTNEALVFDLTITLPNTFKFTASGSGGTFPFRISESLSGMPGTYSLSYGPFPVEGTVDYTLSTTGGAVPEPATWTLMMVGVGEAGATLRTARRKRVSA